MVSGAGQPERLQIDSQNRRFLPNRDAAQDEQIREHIDDIDRLQLSLDPLESGFTLLPPSTACSKSWISISPACIGLPIR